MTQFLISVGAILSASLIALAARCIWYRWKRSLKRPAPMVISFGFNTGDPIMDDYLEASQTSRLRERDEECRTANSIWKRIVRMLRGELTQVD